MFIAMEEKALKVFRNKEILSIQSQNMLFTLDSLYDLLDDHGCLLEVLRRGSVSVYTPRVHTL